MKFKQMGNAKQNLVNEDEDEDNEFFGLISVESSSEEDSRDSSSCSSTLSSLDVEEDDASSPPSPSQSSSSMAFSSNGPLYDLSNLMSKLPVKRGLSKFYEGKSQSFTSLASVESMEDLAKNRLHNRHAMRLKPCKRFGGLLYSPKATISKKKATKTASAMSSLGKRAVLFEDCGFSVPATRQEK